MRWRPVQAAEAHVPAQILHYFADLASGQATDGSRGWLPMEPPRRVVERGSCRLHGRVDIDWIGIGNRTDQLFGVSREHLDQAAGVRLPPFPTHQQVVMLDDLAGRIVGPRFPGCIDKSHISF